jgi:hypothetical protein
MPQIIVEYDLKLLDDEQLERLDINLTTLCFDLLSSGGEWVVPQDKIGFKPVKIVPPARSTHNVIVRLNLHDFPERLSQAAEHAMLIEKATRTVLTSYGHPEGTRIGVGLSYGTIEWAEGMINYGEL